MTPPPPLSGISGFPELGGMVSDLPCDHLLVLPKLHHNAMQFCPRPISLYYMQEASAVQCVIGLTNVQEK